MPIKQKIYEMSFVETANSTAMPINVFSCFLKESRFRDGGKSTAEKYFEIYKKCKEYRDYPHQSIGREQLNELKELELQHSLVNYLQSEIKAGKKAYIDESIIYISAVMAKYIESSKEFSSYKKFILRKIEEEMQPKANQFENYEANLVKVAGFSKKSGQKSNLIGHSVINILLQFICLMVIFNGLMLNGITSY